VAFEEHFSSSSELNVKSVIKTLHKYSCITGGKKENMKRTTSSRGGGQKPKKGRGKVAYSITGRALGACYAFGGHVVFSYLGKKEMAAVTLS
jgi:hypothetical protein